MPRKPTPPEMINTVEIGKRMGMATETVNELLRHKQFPVGFAYQTPTGRWAYKIPREAFEKYLRGEYPEETERGA